mgnify:CR=1 FL=1
MISGLVVLVIIITYLIYGAVTKLASSVPPVRDYERFNRESIMMSKSEVQKAMKAGRWS